MEITWDDPEELDKYIHKLQKAAEKLTTENRKLRKCHLTVCEKVQTLMGVDLLRQQQKWKDGLMEIRHLMANLVNQVLNNLEFDRNLVYTVDICLNAWVLVKLLRVFFITIVKQFFTL